ncbi:MAG: hypothetical protein HC897_12870 [Thermoanaerobaculia bacterium]|nr:hypothetical protein [Thermoanaerobaculia bacterium]
MCSIVGGEEGYFHAVSQTGGTPVPDDFNVRLEMVIFHSSDDYETYSGEIFGNYTNNGGVYLEGNPADPANQARFRRIFNLVAAMNPCPCGFLGHPARVCADSPAAVQRYQGRVSGPFLDRLDLVVPVTPLTADELATAMPGEPSCHVRERISPPRAPSAHVSCWLARCLIR